MFAIPRPTVRSDRAALAAISALTLALATVVVFPTSANAVTPSIDSTSCSRADSEAALFTPIQQARIPVTGAWSPDDSNWIDRGSSVPEFDRIGYCLELEHDGVVDWVWTSMKPWTHDVSQLTMSLGAGAIGQTDVDDLRVASNVSSVTAQSGASGRVEIWPTGYWISATGQVPSASSDTFDSDDVVTGGTYGSFQVHAYGATDPAKTVLAVNGWTGTGTIDVGIGQQSTGHPDWTFAGNAGQYTLRTLTTYARQAEVSVTSFPTDEQFYARDASGNATVPISGRVNDPTIRYMLLRITTGDKIVNLKQRIGASGLFSFSPSIRAQLAESTFELKAWRFGSRIPSSVTMVDTATGVVAGDVIVIEGQSNAESAPFSGDASAEASPFVRSFGSSTSDPAVSVADRSWHDAIADRTMTSGAVGQWGLRMAHRLSVQQQIPIAVFNGAHGGQPVSFFQRNDDDPADATTNYGRLFQRLEAAGLSDDVKAVLWYQGENESDDAATHVAGFTALLNDWREDFGAAVSAGTLYNVFQVRTSPCWWSEAVALRDAQRLMRDTLDVNVLSTTALDAHDGCHFAYEGGYRELGDQAAAVLSRDLYGGPSSGVTAPDPANLTWTDDSFTAIRVTMRDADQLTVEEGAYADFRVSGSNATVVNVTAPAPGVIELTLSAPAPEVSGISYVSHLGAGAAITTSLGVGLLAFAPLAID